MTTALVAQPTAAIARATIAHHSKSFALASRLLPPRIGDQTAVIYTWCRRADDAVDLGAATDETIARLDRELVAAYAGTADDPVLSAFGAVARERRIPIEYPRELLAGMAMDVHQAAYADLPELLLYCWRVAGVVGLMMTHVFGIADDRALVNAAHLGIAMQLTNICRDVKEDRERGRVYVPPGETTASLLARADEYYRSGDRGIRDLPWRAGLAVRAARNIYSAIGPRVSPDHRAVVPTPAKLGLVAKALGRQLVTRPARVQIPTTTLRFADACP
ncbi:MAG: phytoene/squalene synthase family protein [Kofleriaceae bacterium]